MNQEKTIRVSAQVNGRKALDSKTCSTLEEAFENLKGKILKYGEKHTVRSARLCVGKLTENNEFRIEHELNKQLVSLIKDEQYHTFPFQDIYFSVSLHGLP